VHPDFATVHHELGHNIYRRAYNRLDPLFRESAHDGFHEAVGDTIGLEYFAPLEAWLDEQNRGVAVGW
jgi:hypothetical protein